MIKPNPMSHHSSSQRATTLLLLLTLSIICSATPTPSPSTRKRQTTPTSSPACGFAGNPDIYGLGIRLGLYAQWLSTFLSNWLHSAKVTDMRALNTFFQFAMFTALVAMANQTPIPHMIDPYIVIIQIIGSVSCCLSREKEEVADTKVYRHPQFRRRQHTSRSGRKHPGAVSSGSSCTLLCRCMLYGTGSEG